MMILDKLQIERCAYGPNKGQFVGEARFEGDAGDVRLSLTPDQCARIFAVCADAIVSVGREAAETLTREAMATIAQPVNGKVIT